MIIHYQFCIESHLRYHILFRFHLHLFDLPIIRMYLIQDSKIEDVPFGVMVLLHEKEFVIKSHIWTKNTMTQPQLYRFKMRVSQRYKDIERYTVLEIELENIAVQLFHDCVLHSR